MATDDRERLSSCSDRFTPEEKAPSNHWVETFSGNSWFIYDGEDINLSLYRELNLGG
jgi:hypothetical protein